MWWDAVVARERTRRDVETEFQFHIDTQVEDLVRQGLPEAEARRRAHVQMGRPDLQGERYRDAIGMRFLDEMSRDFAYGLRALFRNPGLSCVAVLSLAIGIGGTAAMFTLIQAVLLHPFPYRDSDRIMNPVVINEKNPQQVTWFALVKPQFEALGRAKCIESLLGFRDVNAEITGGGLPEDVALTYLTENAGEFFDVRPILGRFIEPADAAHGGQSVVVLNYRFWQRHFQGSASVIGRVLEVDHRNYTIVGVMPRSFAFNDTLGVGDVYLPRSLLHDSVKPPIEWPYTPWIKIKRGVSLESADAELGAIVRQFARETPRHFPEKFHLNLQPIVLPYQQSMGKTLLLLFLGVLFLLLIGCANCSILLLARGVVRRHEFAVRNALGASRWRIIRQLLVESLVISFAGTGLGVALSLLLARLPIQLSPHSFPAEAVIRVDPTVLAFSAALACICGIGFGLAPALSTSRFDLSPLLQRTLHRSLGGNGTSGLNILLAAQTALTLLLMATGATAIGTFLHVMRVPLGFDPHDVLNAGIMTHWSDPTAWTTLGTRTGRVAYFEQIREKMASVPGVQSVAIGIDVNPPYGGIEQKIETSGDNSSAQQEVGEQRARIMQVGENYFSTLRIPLRSGQSWDETENQRGDGVAVVNEAFVRRYALGGNPVGKRIRIPGLVSRAGLVAASTDSAGWRTVLGVVGDVPNDGLSQPAVPAVYVPYTTMLVPYAQYNIRTLGDPRTYLQRLRTAVASVAPDQQISTGASTLEEVLEEDSQWTRQRLFSVLFGIFSAMALLLALVGLYSAVSFTVSRRTSEFGVRTALGASRLHILWTAARISLGSATVGIVVGATAELCLQKILGTWMKSDHLGASGLAIVAVLLASASVFACLIPAFRAMRIHPVEALRCE
jgi:predicted permease